MVSTPEVGGGNTINIQVARKNQLKPNNKKSLEFTGDAKAESNRLSTDHCKWSQSDRTNYSCFIELIKLYWGQEFSTLGGEHPPHAQKTQGAFIPANVSRSVYGALTVGVLI